MGYLETGEEEQAPGKSSQKMGTRGAAPTEIKDLLNENLKLNREMYAMVKGIKKYVLWQQIWSIFKILIIVVPIVLGIIYLPAMLEPFLDQYRELMDGFGGVNALSDLTQK